jgi:ATPase family associated with various cellular activities (AAA)
MFDKANVNLLHVLVLSWLLPLVSYITSELKSQVHLRLYRTISINADDTSFQKMKYALSKNAIVVNKAIVSGGNKIYDNFVTNDYNIILAIPPGRYYMTSNNTLFTLEYSPTRIDVSCFAWKGFMVLLKFIKDAMDEYDRNFSNMIPIYSIRRYGDWGLLKYAKPRLWNTVVLPKETKDAIKTSIDNFMGKKELYGKLGIMYKHTIILSGLPGTGKSSMGLALASMYDRNLYIVDIKRHDVWDHFQDIQKDSIILIEDIDRMFLPIYDASGNLIDHKPDFDLSKLLNILDGVVSTYNCITLITTNETVKLPEALVRPGRVDLTIKFGYCTLEQSREYTSLFYDLDMGDELIDEFCTTFFDMCDSFTISKLQQYLMNHDSSIQLALDGLHASFGMGKIEEKEKEKEKGKEKVLQEMVT